MTIEKKRKGSYKNRDKFLFWDFPNIDYEFKIGEKITIKNFLHRFSVLNSIKNNPAVWTFWLLSDKETPEIIAQKLYKSPHLYWVVTIINDILNPRFDWPLTQRELYKLADEKYNDVESLHHYESDSEEALDSLPIGTIVPESYTQSRKDVSNLEFEMTINEGRRKIVLLKPEYLYMILKEFNDIKRTFNR